MKLREWTITFLTLVMIFPLGGCSKNRVIIVRSTHPPNAIVFYEKGKMLNIAGSTRYNLWHLGRYSGQINVYNVGYPPYFFQSDTSMVIVQ